MAGRVLHVECCAPATATAMATASATAATTDTASNRHPSRRQDQPPAKKNCVANWLQWLPLRCCFWLLPPTTDLRPLLLRPLLANKITHIARWLLLAAMALLLSGYCFQLLLLLLLRLLLRLRLRLLLRLLKRHPSRQQDHPHRQMATHYWPQWLYYFPAAASSCCYGCCCGYCYCCCFGYCFGFGFGS